MITNEMIIVGCLVLMCWRLRNHLCTTDVQEGPPVEEIDVEQRQRGQHEETSNAQVYQQNVTGIS